MKTYYPTIGLEIHAELKTRTKMFCDSKNDPDEERPNVNVCPICMGHPGTLPVINKEAVKHVLKVGLALGSELADFTEFDRKHYFYPDIPKGYQLSQYKYPLVTGGTLNGIAITRIHLEEDTARSSHDESKSGEDSLVDFNRAGVPLMELVTEPVIHSAEDASGFARELQLLLQYLGAAEANMEKGEMRVEANISVSTDPKAFGTKVEVKNLNSFKAVEKAIAFELKRHEAALEKGEKIIQETRGWDEHKEVTFSQRRKEDSHDYRYFPDPDLPKLKLSEIPEFAPTVLKKELPTLPSEKRKEYIEKYHLKPADAEIFVQDIFLRALFEGVLKQAPDNDPELIRLTGNYIISDIVSLLRNGKPHTHPMTTEKFYADFFELMNMIKENKISSRGAKDILKIMYEKGGEPKGIAAEHNLIQKSDQGELKALAEKLIAANPSVVADYKAGKAAALQYFIGQAMKETKGGANPLVIRQIFTDLLL